MEHKTHLEVVFSLQGRPELEDQYVYMHHCPREGDQVLIETEDENSPFSVLCQVLHVRWIVGYDDQSSGCDILLAPVQ